MMSILSRAIVKYIFYIILSQVWHGVYLAVTLYFPIKMEIRLFVHLLCV